jgi:glycosyltransferase involved in cell wall biosynthesis
VSRGGEAPLTVLFLAEALFVGGREEVILLEAGHLDSSRFRSVVGVLSDKAGPVGAELAAAGVKVVALGQRTHRLSLPLLRALAGLVRAEGVAIIHAHDYKSALYARLLSRGRLPVIYTVHYSYDSPRLKHRLVNRLLARWADAVIGVSPGACEAIARLDRLPAGKVRLLPNAINPERLQAGQGECEKVRQELGLGAGATVFVSVARLEEDKGLGYMLSALARLHENCSGVIIGHGPAEAALKDQAGSLGLSGRVVFAGMRRDLGRYLCSADAFVLPSLDEAFGLVLAEAMHAGLPVICTDVGGTGGVVEAGRQGLLVPPGDVGALAEAMAWMAQNPERAKEMGQAGRLRVEERFLPRHHLAGLEALYEEVLGRSPGQEALEAKC